jgi:radical SAM superfamily enzyme YgiQ (UPF0313 family)
MSNLGIHAIYSLLNSYPWVVCERVFWESGGQSFPVLSLESRRPLSDFTALAFSISYELDYFHAVQILKASGIPLYSTDRGDRQPLFIAGGASITANPMPLAPFFDCLCIGEAEPILPEILTMLADETIGRDDRLRMLAELPGCYVPLYHQGAPVTRQWAHHLDDFVVSSTVLTPDTDLGDLYLIEVERGCGWGCRYCLVSSAFCPMRYRSVERLVEQAALGLKYRNRLGLVGPAVSDHPEIVELLSRLRQLGAGLSISSLRVGSRFGMVLDEMVRGGATTITLAPEAGSERLRRLIGKCISEGDIIKAVERVAECGVRRLKLYYMIGLPMETDADVEEIATLTLRCKDVLDKGSVGSRLVVNVTSFVPKAGTPFQWLPMADLYTVNRRLAILKKRLPSKGIQFKSESPAWSQVQGALARGDVKLAEVLAGVEEMSLAGWRRAVEKCHLDNDFYVLKRWPAGNPLPWAVVDLGVSQQYLEREMDSALAAGQVP